MKKFRALAYEARFVALACIALIVTTNSVVLSPSEPHVRRSGAFLLVLGLILVFCQLRSTARKFNYPSLRHGFFDWLNRVRLAINPRPPLIVSGTGASVLIMGTSAKGVVTRTNPDLATQIADLRREFEDRKKDDDARHQALVERIDKEGVTQLARTATLEAAHEALDVRVVALAVEDLYTAFIGLFLTMVGTIETGFAPDIARLLGG